MFWYLLPRLMVRKFCITGKESDKRLHRATLCITYTIPRDSSYLQINQDSHPQLAVLHTVILSNVVTVPSLLFGLGPPA